MGRVRYGGVPSTQSTFQVGQLAVGMTAATFGVGDLNSGVRLNPTGEDNIFIGGSGLTTTTGYILDSEVFIDIDNLEKIYVMADAEGSTLSFIAS
tara:strand:+ start:2147 stop:2431 length:285 start_codon:yes stop_codon:yes gene_type:complete